MVMTPADREEMMAWFARKEGHPAADIKEAVARFLAEEVAINPRLAKRRELLVAFARGRGGRTLSYARLWEPYAFGVWHLKRSNEAVCQSLRISNDDGLIIVDDILRNVLPAVKRTPEYAAQPTPEHFVQVDMSA